MKDSLSHGHLAQPGNYLPIMLLFIHRRYELNYRIFMISAH